MSEHVTQTSSFNQSLLTAMDDRGIVQDRLPGDKLLLPNDMYEIKVSVNDFVTAETINYSLSKLYDNWLYLISKSIIPSNNIPNNDYYTKIAIDTPGSGLRWTAKTNFPSLSTVSSNNSLNGIKNLTKVINTADPNNYNIIATTNTNVILLSGSNSPIDDSNIDIIVNEFNGSLSDSSITHPSNNINFKSIIDHTLNKSNDLFILDNEINSLFKFDISGILTLDTAILNNDTPGRLMTGLIGGPGDISDRTKFNDPVSVVSVDNAVYVLDYSNTGAMVKMYDSELNWKESFSLGQYVSSGPIDIAYNHQVDMFCILCHEGTFNSTTEPTVPRLMTFDKAFNYISTYDLMDESRHSVDIKLETYKKINFSVENPNIMYILTSTNIYKKYLSSPEMFIGNFLLDEKPIGPGSNAGQVFEDITILPTVITHGDESIIKDDIIIYESTFEVIHKFLEDSNYQQSLETKFDDKVLGKESLMINPDENVNTFVYNKTLSKHLYNNIILLENTSRKFATTYDVAGISQYIGFKYLTKTELSSLEYRPGMDNFIGINEIVTTHTVNRCLEQIYNLQKVILNNWQEKPTNVFPLINTPVHITI